MIPFYFFSVAIYFSLAHCIHSYSHKCHITVATSYFLFTGMSCVCPLLVSVFVSFSLHHTWVLPFFIPTCSMRGQFNQIRDYSSFGLYCGGARYLKDRLSNVPIKTICMWNIFPKENESSTCFSKSWVFKWQSLLAAMGVMTLVTWEQWRKQCDAIIEAQSPQRKQVGEDRWINKTSELSRLLFASPDHGHSPTVIKRLLL